MDRSAQCASSMTSSTGLVSASCSSRMSTCSNSRARASPGVLGRGRLTELGQQPGQLPGRAAGQQVGDPGRAQIPDQLTEHGGERGERQAVRRPAPGSRRPAPGRPRPRDRAANSASSRDLPTPASPADQDGRRVTAARLGQRGAEHGSWPDRPTSTDSTCSSPPACQLSGAAPGRPVTRPPTGEPNRITFPSGSVCAPSRSRYSIGLSRPGLAADARAAPLRVQCVGVPDVQVRLGAVLVPGSGWAARCSPVPSRLAKP